MASASATARVVAAPPLELPRPRPAGGYPRPARPPVATSDTRVVTPQTPGWPLLRACRPRQWLKNAVVLIAPATAGALTRSGAPLAMLGAFAAFCLISSATYLVNDVRDLESDRCHPRKRLRPVAAGELSVAAALGSAAVLAAGAVILALLVRPALVVVIAGYCALTLSYTLVWRDVVVMDMLVVAGGFVFRAVAGGAAVGVSLSSAFLVVTSACALFLVVGKRQAELAAPGRLLDVRRPLERYSPRFLHLLLIGSACAGCLAYANWSLGRPAAGPWLGLSLVPFGLWLGRYAALVRGGAGEAPEELVLGDRGLMWLSLTWTLLFIAGIYGAG